MHNGNTPMMMKLAKFLLRLRLPTAREMRYARRYPRYLAEALLVWLLLLPLARLLGLDASSALFGRLGRRIGSLLPVNRAVRVRIAEAMPEKTAADINAILAGMWEHLARMAAEILFLPKFAAPPQRARVTLEGEEHFRAAFAGERGVFLLTGHIGNWEIMLPVLARLTERRGMVGVYRPLNNPFLDAWLLRLRHAAVRHSLLSDVERRLIPKTGDQLGNIRAILRALHEREGVTLLVDQKTSQGIESRLFGMPAMTTHLPAQLAIEGGHAILPFAVTRREGAHFVFRFFAPIAVPEAPADTGKIAALTRSVNVFLEERIREHPEQWLWLHNRWRPNEKKR